MRPLHFLNYARESEIVFYDLKQIEEEEKNAGCGTRYTVHIAVARAPAETEGDSLEQN